MNPHDLFTADHDVLRKQAESLKSLVSREPQKLEGALSVFQTSVQKHFKREDSYYRIVDNEKRIPDRGLIHQLRNDHAAVIFTLESLAIRLRKNGVNADWLTRFDNLMNVFIPHLKQEEETLFPIGRKMLTSAELDSISEHIQSCE